MKKTPGSSTGTRCQSATCSKDSFSKTTRLNICLYFPWWQHTGAITLAIKAGTVCTILSYETFQTGNIMSQIIPAEDSFFFKREIQIVTAKRVIDCVLLPVVPRREGRECGVNTPVQLAHCCRNTVENRRVGKTTG